MKTSDSKYAQCMYFSSSAFSRKIEKLAINSWKPVDLSPSHGYLLMLVLQEPGIQPGTLADHLQLQPSTVTRLIEKLEEKKLVVRTSDGKLTNVYPTPKAKELTADMQSCMNNFQQAFTKVLGKDDSCRLVQLMNKLSDKLAE